MPSHSSLSAGLLIEELTSSEQCLAKCREEKLLKHCPTFEIVLAEEGSFDDGQGNCSSGGCCHRPKCSSSGKLRAYQQSPE